MEIGKNKSLQVLCVKLQRKTWVCGSSMQDPQSSEDMSHNVADSFVFCHYVHVFRDFFGAKTDSKTVK